MLERVKDGDKGTTTVTVKRVSDNFNSVVDTATKAAIRDGQFEFCRLQLYDNIVGATATLFTEEGVKYEYDNEKAGEYITEKRQETQVMLSDMRWDTIACGVKSCYMYLEVKGDRLVETEVRPTSIWVIFADSITDNGKPRATDTNNIDEASLVIMQLAGEDQFAAWWGPSEMYPTGRHCTYTAKKFSDVPNPEDKGSSEYTIQGEYSDTIYDPMMLANPLTLWGVKGGSNPPVYPFSILYGSPLSTGLAPVSTSLYETGLEFDLAASLILGAAGRGARGAQVVKQTDANADPMDIPDNTSEGMIVMGRSKDLQFTGWSPTHAKAAMEVLSDQAKKIAEANHVPGYLAVSNDSAAPPSGIAVRRLNEPRTDFRRLRVNMNRAGVARRWEIEKALLNAVEGKAVIPENTVEVWHAGNIEFTVDPTEKLAEWEQRIKIGEASILDVIQDMRGFSNISDALVWAEERKQLIDENKELLDALKPAAPAAAPARGGLFGQRG